MKRVIKVSKAWIAAFVLGALLTGCGGSSSTVNEQASTLGPSAILSWRAPTKRVNGENLSRYELEKYTIRYGNDLNNLDKVVVIDNVGGLVELSHEVTDLSAGTWYFTIQVQDAGGLTSEASDVVSKTISS
jgi:hypothetical protein